MIKFTTFPDLETKNLLLRKMNYGDINDLFEMRNDPSMNMYTDTKPDQTFEETKSYIDKMNKGIYDNKWIIWAIEYKGSKKVIGSVCIWNIDIIKKSGELGYGIIPDYQGKGLMQESLLNVIDYGFNVMNLKSIKACTEENNIKSINLLKRCNFNFMKSVDDKGYFNNRIYHMMVYNLENRN